MKLNRMFRYSLLHKRIIHTTLLFHRAFLAASWSWLSCIHNNLWNGSWIVINSSFQSLVSPHITCIHLNAFMQCTTTFAPLPTFLGLLSSSNMYLGMIPFYIQTSKWYEVSYLYHSMEFFISKLLPAWVVLTPLTWPIWLVLCRRLQNLLTNFCYGLVALSLPPKGC